MLLFMERSVSINSIICS